MIYGRVSIGSIIVLAIAAMAAAQPPASRKPASQKPVPRKADTVVDSSCFLLYDVNKAKEIRRNPSTACQTAVAPASTFKIAHALAALDAGVVAAADTKFADDGTPKDFPSWRGDQTLASAMRNSVVWYFQRIAEKLGMAREREYLRKFSYGNADPSSGLTTFWLGGSLLITPEQQQRFLIGLYSNKLPVTPRAMEIVRNILEQPPGRVVNAMGEHPFDRPWPPETVVGAKTGAARDRSGKAVRWLVGHVQREERKWIFVSLVIGPPDTTTPLAGVELAAKALREEGVL
jgi:beta-lactamase class D